MALETPGEPSSLLDLRACHETWATEYTPAQRAGPPVTGQERKEAELAPLLDKDLAALNAMAAQRGYPAVWVGGVAAH